MTAVAAALFIDCGVDPRGYQVRPPRARFECLRCHTTEGPVTGARDVADFVAHIRTTHPQTCTANAQGAHAA